MLVAIRVRSVSTITMPRPRSGAKNRCVVRSKQLHQQPHSRNKFPKKASPKARPHVQFIDTLAKQVGAQTAFGCYRNLQCAHAVAVAAGLVCTAAKPQHERKYMRMQCLLKKINIWAARSSALTLHTATSSLSAQHSDWLRDYLMHVRKKQPGRTNVKTNVVSNTNTTDHTLIVRVEVPNAHRLRHNASTSNMLAVARVIPDKRPRHWPADRIAVSLTRFWELLNSSLAPLLCVHPASADSLHDICYCDAVARAPTPSMGFFTYLRNPSARDIHDRCCKGRLPQQCWLEPWYTHVFQCLQSTARESRDVALIVLEYTVEPFLQERPTEYLGWWMHGEW